MRLLEVSKQEMKINSPLGWAYVMLFEIIASLSFIPHKWYATQHQTITIKCIILTLKSSAGALKFWLLSRDSASLRSLISSASLREISDCKAARSVSHIERSLRRILSGVGLELAACEKNLYLNSHLFLSKCYTILQIKSCTSFSLLENKKNPSTLNLSYALRFTHLIFVDLEHTCYFIIAVLFLEAQISIRIKVTNRKGRLKKKRERER